MLTRAPVSERPDALARIGVLDRNRAAVARIARIVGATSGLAKVATADEPSALRAQLAPNTQLLLCSADELELMLEWAATRYPLARVVTWATGSVEPLLRAAAAHPRLCSILAWPSFSSMPRQWELALATRVALRAHEPPLHAAAIFGAAAVAAKYRPASTAARDAVTAAISALAERAGASRRLVERIGETCHELVMNAMYDAPVNHYGEPRYAHDRKATIALDDLEVPTVRFTTDGALLALQVTDPFGRLERRRVLSSISRGQAAATTDDPDQVLDVSHGGAGLGLWKVYAAATSTIVEVVPGHVTSVSAVFDLDLGVRESRSLPTSLHVFAHGELPDPA